MAKDRRGERVERPPKPPGELGAVLGDLVALVRGGAFLHTPDPEDCKFCELGGACGTDPTGRATRKVAGSSAALAAYRQLQRHD